ncbi:methylenetetrahydrofolate reductase [Halarsenatibacter silvermanii]|uniref:Methylenetetrahydrofolate reductase n=1 Tax=Halarsenatibacter silvermanii TaxID=321763 RepID=A0A1G9I512_9FIRM|nr:methylenetetrahydrofolate reductase [Halarsenatibacter silvermanii]SDL19954.1 5,10-methylenetetrahydrofolate reductase (ferredoxin) [Halarsenatibacter silvermanii]
MPEYISNLHKLLEEDHFVVCSEMGPPIGADPDFIREKCEDLHGYVDAVNVTDNQTAIVRMSSIAASKIAHEEGLEMIIQATTRDRNRIGLQSDLLGASALGLRNVLCLTGDHQSFGKDEGSKNVFDMDSVSLIKAARDMVDDEELVSGDELRTPPKLYIGGAHNPFAEPYEMHMLKLKKKIKAGMDFIQTQCIYNLEKFDRWMEDMRKEGLHEEVHILAGLLPTKSEFALKYMKNDVPGMDVPDELIDRIANADDKRQEGIDFTVEIIEHVKNTEGVKGIHLMPVGWEEITPVVVEEAGLYPRPEVEVDDE